MRCQDWLVVIGESPEEESLESDDDESLEDDDPDGLDDEPLDCDVLAVCVTDAPNTGSLPDAIWTEMVANTAMNIAAASAATT